MPVAGVGVFVNGRDGGMIWLWYGLTPGGGGAPCSVGVVGHGVGVAGGTAAGWDAGGVGMPGPTTIPFGFVAGRPSGGVSDVLGVAVPSRPLGCRDSLTPLTLPSVPSPHHVDRPRG